MRLVRAGLFLLTIMSGAFVTGLASYAGLALFGGFGSPIIWLVFAAWTVVRVLMLPIAMWLLASPFLDLCSSHDHISEILLPLQLAGPAVVFAAVCTTAFLLTRWYLSFPAIVARSAIIAGPTFLVLHAGGTALLGALHAACPPPPM